MMGFCVCTKAHAMGSMGSRQQEGSHIAGAMGGVQGNQRSPLLVVRLDEPMRNPQERADDIKEALKMIVRALKNQINNGHTLEILKKEINPIFEAEGFDMKGLTEKNKDNFFKNFILDVLVQRLLYCVFHNVKNIDAYKLVKFVIDMMTPNGARIHELIKVLMKSISKSIDKQMFIHMFGNRTEFTFINYSAYIMDSQSNINNFSKLIRGYLTDASLNVQKTNSRNYLDTHSSYEGAYNFDFDELEEKHANVAKMSRLISLDRLRQKSEKKKVQAEEGLAKEKALLEQESEGAKKRAAQEEEKQE